MFKRLIIGVLTLATVIGCAGERYQQKEKAEDEIAQGNQMWEASANQFRYAWGIESMIRTGAVPPSKEALTEVRAAYQKSRDSLIASKNKYQSAYSRAKDAKIPVKNHGQLIDRINEVAHTIAQIDGKISVLDQDIKNALPKSKIKVKGPKDLDA